MKGQVVIRNAHSLLIFVETMKIQSKIKWAAMQIVLSRHRYAHVVQHCLDLPGVLLHPSGEDVRGRVELLLDDIDLLLDISWEEDLVDRDVLRRRQAAGEVPQVVHRQVALPEDVVDGPDGAPVE